MLAHMTQPLTAAEATPAPSDEALARGVQAGRPDDLAALVERHHSPLLGFLYRLTGGDRPLAEDLVQETFLRVLRGIGHYQAPRPFKPWLYAVAVNAARDHFKRAETRRTAPMPLDYDAPGEPSPLHAVLEDETWAQVAGAVRALPAQQREVLLLRYSEGWALADIAAALGIPEGTVKSRLSIALSRVRAHLAAQDAPA